MFFDMQCSQNEFNKNYWNLDILLYSLIHQLFVLLIIRDVGIVN